MSKSTSSLPPSRLVQPGQRWGIRAFVLVFLCVLLLWTDIFAGWTATPAHAATQPNPNPVLKAPSWLQSWLWQDQQIAATWQPITSTLAAAGTRALVLPASSAVQVLSAHKDVTTKAVWSVSTNLGAVAQGIHSSPPQSLVAAASSAINFNTEDPTASWGKARDVDVGLSSGLLNYSYPLSIPPGPGGLTPPVNLAYSSGSVNESHKERLCLSSTMIISDEQMCAVWTNCAPTATNP